MATPFSAYATRWTLVDFGSNLTSYVTPHPGWTNILRHPTRTQFVNPDGNPDHAGITITPGLTETEQSYFGIRGSAPITFQPGHEIICTLYNRSDYSPYPSLRISFNDPNEPDPEDPTHPWFTTYNSAIHINTSWVEPYSLVELRYYIQDEDMLAAIEGVVSTGQHAQINVNFPYFGVEDPALVLTKIEYSDEADLTPPNPPTNFQASCVSLADGASANVVRLTWSPATDSGAHPTGISHYYIYRDGELYDSVSSEMAAFMGDDLYYLDLSAPPATGLTYAVAALDKAQYGLYPRHGRPPSHPANLSEQSTSVTVTTPVWQSSTLLNPWTDLDYAGGFRLPIIDEYWYWSYASAGLTWYPGGNPARDPSTEMAGSLYAYSQTQRGIGELSIPHPVLSTNLSEWPRAQTLKPVTTNLWPLIYDGNPVPAGGHTHQP